MNIFKKISKELWFVLIILVVGFLFLWFFGNNNKKQDRLILENGIETTGTIICKLKGSDNSAKTFGLKYDFKIGDTLYAGYLDLYNNSFYYKKAIIGMKYKVKYLPGNTQNHNNSRIYIDHPILEEFNNIKAERDRIINVYENGAKCLKDTCSVIEGRIILGL
ncbi:MAG: hypothetical protein IPM71_15470 [Bacteroidota bacterium]|nr:MAG: hypothetical protein IPM71_15470 [Bacteroidota bacterium]